MYTTYHLTSAQDVSTDILDAIKATFKSKPITIIVREDNSNFELTADMKSVLDERLQEDENTYLSANESINQLKKSVAYKIIVSLRAQKEIENAIDYYALYSPHAPVNFIAT